MHCINKECFQYYRKEKVSTQKQDLNQIIIWCYYILSSNHHQFLWIQLHKIRNFFRIIVRFMMDGWTDGRTDLYCLLREIIFHMHWQAI